MNFQVKKVINLKFVEKQGEFGALDFEAVL